MKAALALVLVVLAVADGHGDDAGPTARIPLAECPNAPKITLPELRKVMKDQGLQPIANLDEVWAYATGDSDGSNLPETTSSGHGGLMLGKDKVEGWIRRNDLISDFDPSAREITRSCRMFNRMILAGDEDFKDLQSKDKTSYACFENIGFFVLRYTNPLENGWTRTKEDERMQEQIGLMTFRYFDGGIEAGSALSGIRWTRFSGIVSAAQPESFKHPTREKDDPFLKELGGPAADASVSTTEINFLLECGRGLRCANGDAASRTITIRRSTSAFVDHYHSQGTKTLDGHWTGFCSVYPK